MMIQRYALFLAVLAGAVVVSVAMRQPIWKPTETADHSKMLKFSHAFHVSEQGIACVDCHADAPTSTAPADKLVPVHENCQTCHEEQVNSDCAFCHTDPENITPVEQPAREIIFSHERHVTGKSIACETCHAGLDSVDFAGEENMPSMTTCTSCHEAEKVSNNCETCHSDFAGLIPEDHLKGDFRKEHKVMARVGMRDVTCATCHDESFCQDCHTGIELQSLGNAGDLMATPTARTKAVRDSHKRLKLQQVHNLNYRFTHGMDARGKTIDCTSCHEPQTFCAECHEAGENITLGSVKPVNHSVAGFTTLGRGSGGGVHARLARRDLESCASCHDVQGNDPVCMVCHTETGSVR